MNKLQNVFNGQSQEQRLMSKLNQGQRNIVMQLIGMSEEERAEKLAEILNQQGITKNQLENILKGFRK